jgi:hypothetical protein
MQFDQFPNSGATILVCDVPRCDYYGIHYDTVLRNTPYSLCRSLLDLGDDGYRPCVLLDSDFSREVYAVYTDLSYTLGRTPLDYTGSEPQVHSGWDLGRQDRVSSRAYGSTACPWPSKDVDACVRWLMSEPAFPDPVSVVYDTPVESIQSWLLSVNLDLVPALCPRSRRDLVETQRVAQRICNLPAETLVGRWVLHVALTHRTQASTLLP